MLTINFRLSLEQIILLHRNLNVLNYSHKWILVRKCHLWHLKSRVDIGKLDILTVFIVKSKYFEKKPWSLYKFLGETYNWGAVVYWKLRTWALEKWVRYLALWYGNCMDLRWWLLKYLCYIAILNVKWDGYDLTYPTINIQ